SPLLLNVVTVAYAGRPEAPPLVTDTVDERRDHLFGLYVDEMLRRSAAERHYPPEKAVHWLSWLAYQMGNHDQSEFYLERLQVDWLPQGQRQAFRVCNGLIGGLLFGLVFGLSFGLILGLVFGLVFGLGFGLILGLVFGLVFGLGFGLV